MPNEDGTECVTWSPSDDVLDPGDTILAVDGEPIGTVDDLAAVLDGKQPGDVVSMTDRAARTSASSTSTSS